MSNLGQQEQSAQLDSEGMDRGIGFLGLTWASEASLIGSGWLFGALTAVTIAGPSAIIAWVVASIIVGVLALVHAELGGMFRFSAVPAGSRTTRSVRSRGRRSGGCRTCRLRPSHRSKCWRRSSISR